jgi:arginyl-tRNA synthetase
LDEAVARALQIIQEKNPNLENPQKVAEAVGVGAIVFGDLRNNRLNDVDFSLEDAVSFEGETGPYVQYTHARIQSVLAKAEEAIRVENENPLPNPSLADGENDTVTTSFIIGDTSWALLKLLGEYPEYLEKAIHRNEPSVIAKYTIDVAQAFNRFYHAERIADASSDVRSFRVALAKRTAERLAYSLHLLGVQAPERM